MWFGGKQMPSICKECIESWHKVLPADWSFQFWNEDNYDVEINNFVLQAYHSGNYAFVSDYARWDILHRQGGVYVDTDVFLLKDITPLLDNKAFGGQNCSGVFASGLILGAEPSMPICKEMMAEYDRRNFLTKDGKPTFVTNILVENGLLQNKYNFKPDATDVQTVAGITIYPTIYFCPYNPSECKMKTNANTYAIHQFTGTWIPEERKAAQAKANPRLKEHYKRMAL
jgi:hypothetical protein